MFKKLLITMMLVTFGISMYAVTGETPVSGSAYYIYNVGQQKYLNVASSGALELGSEGTQFTVAAGTTTGTYTLTASAKLSSNFNDYVICSDNGWYNEWKFSLISSTEKTYALGVLEDEDAYSFSYMFYNVTSEVITKGSALPNFNNGEWMFVTSTTPEEITYTLKSVEELPDMEYTATSVTVKYTINPSSGSDISCTKTVTFTANDSYVAVTRSGEFTDETYKVTVPWSVNLNGKPITYTLGSVDELGTLVYSATQATVTYTIHPSYGNDIKCTQDVTFDANDTYSVVTRSGEFTDETYNVTVPWSLSLAAMPQPSGKVTEVTFLQTSDSYAIPDNMAETVTVKFDRTSMLVGKRSAFCVPFDMTYSQAESIFGTNVRIYEYSRNIGTRIYYSTAGSIEAGKPYVIVPTVVRDGDYYVVENVAASSFVSEPTTVTIGSFGFTGTFAKLTPAPANIYTYNNGTFYHYSSASYIYAFRAYFRPVTAGAKISAEYFDDEVDGVSEITEMPSESFDVYTVNGQMVKSNVTSLKGLSRGVYVVDGKKVVIK